MKWVRCFFFFVLFCFVFYKKSLDIGLIMSKKKKILRSEAHFTKNKTQETQLFFRLKNPYMGPNVQKIGEKKKKERKKKKRKENRKISCFWR